MSQSTKNRLQKLENTLGTNNECKIARVVCASDIFHTFDRSKIKAKRVLILPDNGRRLPHGQTVPKGSYLVFYS